MLDLLDVPALGATIEVTIVDLANLCVFFKASAVGMAGTESPREITPQMLSAMTAVKEAAAVHLGIPTDGLIPLPVAVASPAAYSTYLGTTVQATSVDLLARLAGGRPPMLHKTFPGTAAACTAVAAALSGSILSQVARRAQGGRWTIGHPGGVMPVLAEVREEAGYFRVERAAYTRTARRLLEGRAFIRRARLQPIVMGAPQRVRAGSASGVSEGRA